MSARPLVALLAVLAVLLTGCVPGESDSDGVEPDVPEAEPLRPAWRSLTLPTPPGGTGRLMVRDAVACDGRWFVVGGVADAAGRTRPAAWVSSDATSWSPLPVAASSFYGRQHVFSAVACRAGRVAAIGAKSGGVHGNPRVGTWVQGSGGTLREVAAPLEWYGGPRAVGVSRLAAGPAGWLVVGTRVDGAAVWTSPDAEGFTPREGVAELAGDERGGTFAYDATAVSSGWLVVGAVLPLGGAALVPLAWTSSDGRVWRRAVLPTPDGQGQAQRVASVGGAAVAVGPVPGGFGAWRLVGLGWRPGGRFGGAGPGVSSVGSLVAAGRALVVVVADGRGHGVWLSADSGDSWRAVALPVAVPDAGGAALAVASWGDRLLLVADDGLGSRAWWAGVPTADR
ncbi:hypothetical protein NCC78_06965 [Micromonospora phytophila]|uniref:hypothetical protein n=1 Tax=Micromonospora phytophila TaxID=709888 RepID=UPI00202EA050|nr:hypothetical protein [Micromonospora phytophila]MCM0674429.1 hypothetical protein [Micromonospora phytophila]